MIAERRRRLLALAIALQDFVLTIQEASDLFVRTRNLVHGLASGGALPMLDHMEEQLGEVAIELEEYRRVLAGEATKYLEPFPKSRATIRRALLGEDDCEEDQAR